MSKGQQCNDVHRQMHIGEFVCNGFGSPFRPKHPGRSNAVRDATTAPMFRDGRSRQSSTVERESVW
jgi:hypothetical protein